VIQGVRKSVQTERQEEEVGFRDERRCTPKTGRHGTAIFFKGGVDEISIYGRRAPICN
jgi:hypothetical protein